MMNQDSAAHDSAKHDSTHLVPGGTQRVPSVPIEVLVTVKVMVVMMVIVWCRRVMFCVLCFALLCRTASPIPPPP